MTLSDLFGESLFVANRLLEAGNRPDALTVLRLLAENEAFGPVRSIACVNCAIVEEQLGNAMASLAWFDRGIAIEAATPGRVAARFKADLLVRMGRVDEGLALYLELLAGPLQDGDAAAIRTAMAQLDAAG
jgi:hypothetical protein